MSSHAISVHVRVRPHKSSDGPYSSEGIILGEGSASVPNSQDSGQRLKFGLNAVYGPESTQETVFESVKPIIEQVYKGINTTVFAYGVTGSGKTWTMQGTKEDQGIIPRVVKSLFLKKSRLRKTSLKISFSYVEILIEEVYDLLAPLSPSSSSTSSSTVTFSGNPSNAAQGQGPRTKTDRKRLEIRTTQSGENVIAGLEKREISSVAEFEGLYSQASQSRKTASTSLNTSSSRSHAILSLYVETTDLSSAPSGPNVGPQQGQGKTFVGKICLVDLAGSEDNKLTGNDPVRMRESSAINRSLTNLGNVVEALNTGAGRVPYRDSKLTRILQDALGGSSVGMLICNLAPGEKFAKDTLRTLKFASRTKEIENKVVVNERDDRVLPKPHFSAQTRPAIKTSLTSIPATSLPSNQPARPRPPLNSVASSGNTRPAVQPTRSGPASMMNNVRSQIGVAGIALTDDQLTTKIEDIVKQVMQQKEKENVPASGPHPAMSNVQTAQAGPSKLKGEPLGSASKSIGLSEEEKKARAKVLINLGRQHQDEGQIPEAIRYYNQAKAYIPDNKKLAIRIVELELVQEGQVPLQQRAGAKAKRPAECAANDDRPSSGLKRSKAPSRALADITNGFAVRPGAHDEVEDEKHAKSTIRDTKAKVPPKSEHRGAANCMEDKENAMAKPARPARAQQKRKQVQSWDSDQAASDSGNEDGEEEYIPERPAAKKPKRRLGVLTN